MLSNVASVELHSLTLVIPDTAPENEIPAAESEAPETRDVNLNSPTGLLFVFGEMAGGVYPDPSLNVMSFRKNTGAEESESFEMLVVNVPEEIVTADMFAIAASTEPLDEPRFNVTK